MQDCSITYLEDQAPTNASLLRVAIAREYDVKLCNADKAALRAWYDGYCSSKGKHCKAEK